MNSNQEFIINVEKIINLLQDPRGVQQAETSLQQIFKIVQPYQLFFSVLKESRNQLTHFYMLTGIRDAAIREWAILDPSLKLSIVDNLIHYILQLNSNQFLGKASRNQSYNTIAVICKRSWMDTDKHNGLELNQIIMEKIYSDLDSGDFDRMEAAVRMIHSFIIEFSCKSQSARIQLPWEFHMKCLSSFQELHLQPVFRKIMTIIYKLKQQEGQMNQFSQSMLNLTIKIVTDILEWKFLEKGYSSLSYLMNNTTMTHSLRPTPEWLSIFITKNESNHYSSPIIDLLFSVYPMTLGHADLPSIIRSSFTMLSTLTGPVLKETLNQSHYLSILLEKIAPILERCIQIRDWNEMQDLSHLIHRLCMNFKFSGLLQIGNLNLVVTLLRNITKFIFSALNLMKESLERGEIDLESEIELDCLDILFRAWISLSSDIDEQVRRKRTAQLDNFNEALTEFNQCSQQIYQKYIQTRLELSALELIRFDQLEPDNDDNNDLNEDKNKYNDQLKSVAFIGRINPLSAMDLLTGEINRTVALLKTQPSAQLYETLHWLIIFSGHLLFDTDNNILSAIPNTVEDQTYLQYTQQVGRDSVVDLSNAIFKYSIEYENTLVSNGHIDKLSPLLSKTAVWFFAGWSLVYLVPSDQLNVHLSPRLLENFSSEANVKMIVDLLVKKIIVNLKYWSGDNDVLEDTCKLYYNLTAHGKLIPYLIQSESWRTLFFLNDNELNKLSPHIQSELYKATTNIIFKLNNPSEIVKFFNQFTQLLSQQLDSLLTNQNFANIAQDAIVKENLYLIFEKFKGILCVSIQDMDTLFENILSKAEINNLQSLTFDFFMKYANSFIAMLSVYDHYNDIIQIILSLFCNFTKHQVASDEERAKIAYQSVINLFQTIFQITNTIKRTDNNEYYQRIKTLIKILYNITIYNDPSNLYPSLVAKTVFHGINVVTPCLTNQYNLLQYPKLARNYFMVLTYLFNLDDLSEINNFSSNISTSIFKLIESGLLHHDMDIVKGSFECISGITEFAKNLNSKNIPFDQSVLTLYIGSVINFLLLHDFNVNETLGTASDTLLRLILSSPEGYKAKVIELINKQETTTQQRLAQYFETLIITGTDRKSKETFLENLKLLLQNAKPLLKKQ